MRLCSGCQSKIADGVRFCESCQKERAPSQPSDNIRANTAVRRAGTYDAELDKQNKSKRWQDRRARIIRRDAFCKRCETAFSEIVDHVIPAAVAVQQARESGRWPFDAWHGYYIECNLQGLCRSCHGYKTDEDFKHVGAWPSVIELLDRQPKKVWTF